MDTSKDGCGPECSHPEHADAALPAELRETHLALGGDAVEHNPSVLVVEDEPKIDLSTLLDRADAQQAYIDGLISKIDHKMLVQREVMCVALGRVCTIMMEHTSELAEMAKDESKGATPQSRINAARMCQAYGALVGTMRDDIDRFMRQARLTNLVKRPKI